MKRMKGIRILFALLLAFSLLSGTMAGLAEYEWDENNTLEAGNINNQTGQGIEINNTDVTIEGTAAPEPEGSEFTVLVDGIYIIHQTNASASGNKKNIPCFIFFLVKL